MNKILKINIYNEAVEIGDYLLKISEKSKSGTYWKTHTLDNNYDCIEIISDNMYNGTSGIAVFLLDLFIITGDKRYLNTSVSAMDWVFEFSSKEPTYNYGFYTGKMSIGIAAIRFYEYFKDKNYLKKALAVLKNLKKHNTDLIADDLIGGNGGVLLGLLHLHSYTNEEWILNEINRFTYILLNKMYIAKKGIYWERRPDNVSGLCGYSHGAGGLGFIFLELGRYLQNKAFYWLAIKAFDYEAQHFNKVIGNWSDLRRFKTNQSFINEQKNAYLKNDIEYFTKDLFMNAWCHGAAGIGLSRLRAFEVLGEKKYLYQTKTAIKTTVKSDLNDSGYNNLMIYCHGNCGNADLFLESFLRLNNKMYLYYAEQVAEQALKHKKVNGYYKTERKISTGGSLKEDVSLLTGVSGIGHFYLRVINPQKISSVLFPTLNKVIKCKNTISNYRYLNISEGNIKLAAYKKIYPKTIFMLNHYQINIGKVKEKETANITNNFRKIFIKESKKVLGKYKLRIKDIFKLESEVADIDSSVTSFALLDIKRIINNEKTKEIITMRENDINNLNLKLNDTVFICKTKWNWMDKNFYENTEKPRGDYYVLIKQEPEKVSVNHISPFVFIILITFVNGCYVRKSIDIISDQFKIKMEGEKKEFKQLALMQIKELLISQYLIPNIK